MKNFNRDGNKNRSFGGASFNNHKDRGGFNKKPWMKERGGDMPMHKATCSDCGKMCEVPFRPSGIKPVFCNNCFSDKRDSGDRGGRDFNDRGPKRDFDNRPPQSFSKPAGGNDDALKRQLDSVNMKLDRLISAIEKMQDMKQVREVVTAPMKTQAPAPIVEIKKTPVPATTPMKKIETKGAVKKVVTKKAVVTKTVAKKKK